MLSSRINVEYFLGYKYGGLQANLSLPPSQLTRHCHPSIMSSDLQSALELLQLDNYVTGMATTSFSLINFTDKCSCDNHCCRI